MKKLIILLIAFAFFGCVTRWTKSGFSQQQFSRDKLECETLAIQAYRVNEVHSEAAITNSQTNCYTIGSFLNCNTTAPMMVDTSYDSNSSQRKKYINLCLESKGYYRK